MFSENSTKALCLLDFTDLAIKIQHKMNLIFGLEGKMKLSFH